MLVFILVEVILEKKYKVYSLNLSFELFSLQPLHFLILCFQGQIFCLTSRRIPWKNQIFI